jgi:predicted DNA-binding protein (MmcQ/YjbR family)
VDRLEDRRLKRLSEICLELPEAERAISGHHATFRVRKRTFAYFLDDHRGDEGIAGLVCKAAPGRNQELVDRDPARHYLPSYLHHRGWIGFRLDTAAVDWDDAAGLVLESYLLVAPRRLAAQVMGPG